jgi:hypothetical protein
MQVHVLISWYPWEVSPMQVDQIPEPEQGEDNPFLSTWWRARAIRDRLEEAVLREDLRR